MIYDNVKKICKQKSVTILQIEKELDFPRGSIYKWNESVPSVIKVKKVADYLQCTVDELLAETT